MAASVAANAARREKSPILARGRGGACVGGADELLWVEQCTLASSYATYGQRAWAYVVASAQMRTPRRATSCIASAITRLLCCNSRCDDVVQGLEAILRRHALSMSICAFASESLLELRCDNAIMVSMRAHVVLDRR